MVRFGRICATEKVGFERFRPTCPISTKYRYAGIPERTGHLSLGLLARSPVPEELA